VLALRFTQSSRWQHGAFTRRGDTESVAWEDRRAPTTTRRRTGHDGGRHRGMGPAFPGLLLVLGPPRCTPYQPTFRSRHGRLLSPTQTSRSQKGGLAAVCPCAHASRVLDRAAISVVREDLGHSSLLTVSRPGDGSRSGLPLLPPDARA
jgi:hypothetical protein